MSNLPFDITDIDADDVTALEETYEALKQNFKVFIISDDQIHLSEFDVFSNYKNAKIGGTLLINHPESGCYLTFVKVQTVISNGRGPAISYYKYQVWANVTLRSDFGRVIIRRETLVDKILNMVHPVEMRFSYDPAFSRKFNVIANDEDKAKLAMTDNFRNALTDIEINDFLIEISKSTLIIGSNQIINPQQTVYLAGLASKLSIIK